MRTHLWAVPILLCQTAAAATDPDTVCAAVFTYLSESARASGLTSNGFDTGAQRAQNAHMALNPSEDLQRYTIGVIDGAEAIRDGVSRGAIPSGAVVNTAQNCQSRYFAQNGR